MEWTQGMGGMIKGVAFVAAVPLIVFGAKRFRKRCAETRPIRDAFVEYLKGIGDTETLKFLGEINPFGEYERTFQPSHWDTLDYLDRKFEETGDAHYEAFKEAYEEDAQRTRKYMYMVVFGIGVMLFVIVSLFQK